MHMDTANLLVSHRQHVLDLFHAALPGVRGVVLSDPAGAPVAHDAGPHAGPLAAAALREHQASGGVGASTMVSHADGLYLVVFLSAQQAQAWAAPPLPA